MEISLDRDIYTPKSTIGDFSIGSSKWVVLERVRLPENLPDECAVPAGRYEVIPSYSPSFARILPLLVNVPGRSHILIHIGNKPEDTKGCLLPGKEKARDFVGRSGEACGEIFTLICRAWAHNEKVFITIKDKEPTPIVVPTPYPVA